MNHQFFNHHGGGAAAPPNPPRYFLDFLQRFNCTPIQIITSANNIVGGAAAPPQPPRYFFIFFTGIDMPSYLNHHFFDPVTRFVGDARDVGGTCGVYFARTCCQNNHAETVTHNDTQGHFRWHNPPIKQGGLKIQMLAQSESACSPFTHSLSSWTSSVLAGEHYNVWLRFADQSTRSEVS